MLQASNSAKGKVTFLLIPILLSNWFYGVCLRLFYSNLKKKVLGTLFFLFEMSCNNIIDDLHDRYTWWWSIYLCLLVCIFRAWVCIFYTLWPISFYKSQLTQLFQNIQLHIFREIETNFHQFVYIYLSMKSIILIAAFRGDENWKDLKKHFVFLSVCLCL